jgi:hypothetical protein
MPKLPVPRLGLIYLVLLFAVGANDSLAQQPVPDKPVMLITWSVPGAIPFPDRSIWKLDLIRTFSNGNRPVAQFSRAKDSITISYILFPNLSGKPTAQGCRADIIDALVAKFGKSISDRVDSEAKDPSGNLLATTSYRIDSTGTGKQHNLFSFAGNSKTCAEINVSNIHGTPSEESEMQSLLAAFTPDLSYQPTVTDRLTMASLLFPKDPAAAVPYYGTAVEKMSKDADSTMRLFAIDQLVISLGMTGDIKRSRKYAQMGVDSDPDYPLNYYNLACADAEEGKAKDARLHLQQAFDRRANIMKGESFPDPAKDDSLLKLKKDTDFWSFVQSLSKQLGAKTI